MVDGSARAGSAASAHQRVVVVGAGIAGLVSALVLAHRGLDVTVVEAADTPGGKMRQITVDGVGIDCGPTVFTMRWVFDQLLEPMGTSLGDLLVLEPIAVLARHAWRGSAGALGPLCRCTALGGRHCRLQQPAGGAPLFDVLPANPCALPNAGRSLHPVAAPLAVEHGARPGARGLGVLAGLGPFASLERLGPALSRPALATTLRPLRHLLRRLALGGTGHPDAGGPGRARRRVVGARRHARRGAGLGPVRRQQGRAVRYGNACQEILVRSGQARGVLLASGERLDAQAVVFNGDSNALASGMLGAGAQGACAPVPRAKRSLSALTWSMHARTSGFPLVRHNVFFDADYASEFKDIFQHRRLPARGTVYVCAQDRNDSATDPGGPERLLCLVNAPADGDTHLLTHRRPNHATPEAWTCCSSAA